LIIRVDIIRDGLSPLLEALRLKLANRQQMNAAVAQSMATPIKKNFLDLASTNHNSFGVRSTFWGLMNASVAPGADDAGGWISMDRAVALRFFGGTVYPGPGKKALSLPARSEAYGKSPRDFNDLRVIVLGLGPSGGPIAALVQNDQQKISYGRKRKNGVRPVQPGDEIGGGVFFWLVPSATIRPDPTVLPSREILGRAATTGLGEYLDYRQLALSS
jgi:hypothetical protein